MKTRFSNRLIAIIVTAVMTIMCCISPQSLRFDTVLNKKVEIKSYAEGTKSSDYDKAMQLYEEKCYEWLNGNGTEEIQPYDSHFQVFDLSWDEDGIPELIITPSIARGTNCYIYKYYNGEIRERKYTLPNTGGSFEYCEQTNVCKFETRHQGVIEIDLMSFCAMYESWEGIKRSSELSDEPLTYQYYNSASTFDITKEEFEEKLAEIEACEWITVGNEYRFSEENISKVFYTDSEENPDIDADTLLKEKEEELLKSSITTDSILTSNGTDVYNFIGDELKTVRTFMADIDNSGEKELFAVLCSDDTSVIKKYWVENGKVIETEIGNLPKIEYCDVIDSVLFYNEKLEKYCISYSSYGVGAYTGTSYFNINLYTLDDNGINQLNEWYWDKQLMGFDRLESIENELIENNIPYMNVPYISFDSLSNCRSYIWLMHTEIEITDGSVPADYTRYIKFDSAEELEAKSNFLNTVDNNKCGDNLTWEFNETTGELVISGTGEMWDFSETNRPKWEYLKDKIKYAVTTDGVESIGSFAFVDYSIQGVDICNTVSRLGEAVFKGCDFIETIYIPENVIDFGDSIFEDMNYPGFEVHGDKNSVVRTYCMAKNVPFVSIDVVNHINFYDIYCEMNPYFQPDYYSKTELMNIALDDTLSDRYNSLTGLKDNLNGKFDDVSNIEFSTELAMAQLLTSDEYKEGLDSVYKSALVQSINDFLTAINDADGIVDAENDVIKELIKMDKTDSKFISLLNKTFDIKENSKYLEKIGIATDIVNEAIDSINEIYNLFSYRAYLKTNEYMIDALEIYNSNLNSTLEQYEQKLKDLTILKVSKDNHLTYEEKREFNYYSRATDLIKSFITQSKRIIAACKSPLSLAGYITDVITVTGFEIGAMIVAFLLNKAFPVINAFGIVFTAGQISWQIISDIIGTNIDDRALARDLYLNSLILSEEALKTMLSSDGWGARLKSDRTEEAIEIYENGFNIFKKLSLMAYDNGAEYAKIRQIDSIELIDFQDLTLLYKSYYDMCIFRKEGLKSIYCHRPDTDVNEGKKVAESYKAITIACPVDVYVYNGEVLVASIIDDEISINSTEYVIDIDTVKLQENNSSAKCLLIPDDYTINIIGTDTGKMNVSVADVNENNISEVSVILDIPVENENKYIIQKSENEYAVLNDTINLEFQPVAETTAVTLTTTQTNITTVSTESATTVTTEPINKITLGDVNGDGYIDAVDATLVLAEYSVLSTGGSGNFTDIQKTVADVNNDGMTDAVDASLILQYYAYVSTGGKESSEEFFGKK